MKPPPYLVDDIDGQHTEGVPPHEGARGAELVEGALGHLAGDRNEEGHEDTDGGHLGEDPRHRVHAVLGVVLHHRGNLETVLAKLAI